VLLSPGNPSPSVSLGAALYGALRGRCGCLVHQPAGHGRKPV